MKVKSLWDWLEKYIKISTEKMLMFLQSEKVLHLISFNSTHKKLKISAKFKNKEALLDIKDATMSFYSTKPCSVK